MVMVTVESKAELSSIGTHAKNAATYYRDATADADRSFKMRTEGSEGAALAAFVEKVNNLSTYVFSIYPNLLEILGKEIDTYTSALTDDEGFTGDIVYTSDRGISNIQDWLTNKRYNSIETKENDIDKAIAMAKTALEMSPNAVEINPKKGNIQSDAAEELGSLSKARGDKHTNLVGHMRSFRSQLQILQGDLSTLSTYLTNALYLAQVPTETLIGWLENGKLTADNMNLIDSIQDIGDDEMLNVLLREGDMDTKEFYSTLGSVDGSHVSQTMMDHVYSRIYANSDNLDNINAFFDALEKQDESKNKIYMETLAISGARLATVLNAEAATMLPVLTDDYNKYLEEWEELKESGKLNEINATLKKMGALSALFESVAVTGIGKTTEKRPGVSVPVTKRMKNLKKVKTSVDGESEQWEFHWSQETSRELAGKTWMESKEIKSMTTTNGDSVEDKQDAKEYASLQEKKNKAVITLIKDAVIGGSALLAPEFSVALSVASTLSESNKVSSVVSAGNKLADKVVDKQSSQILKGGNRIIEFFETLNDNSLQEEAIQNERMYKFFDAGGNSVTENETATYARFDFTYDLQATLQRYDMEENGLRGYVLREHGSPALDMFDGAIAQIRNGNEDYGKFSTDVIDFFAGTSDKSFSEIGTDEIMKKLEKISTEFGKFGLNTPSNEGDGSHGTWLERYKTENSNTFRELVGG